MKHSKIIGTGYYVPENRVSNFDLEKLMDTSDEWIRQRSGIEERRFVSNGETPSDLAYLASQKALTQAGLSAKDIDLILFSTLSADYYFPGSGVILQHKLGLETTPAIDIRNQCSGFIYGLAVANSMIMSEQYKNILVIGSEVQSTAIDKTTRGRDIAVLFGDGAGAVLLTAVDSHEHPKTYTKLYSQGEHAQKLWLAKPGTAGGTWLHDERHHPEHYPSMDGKFVFKNAVTRIPEAVNNTLKEAKIPIEEVDHFLFHQANLRINEFVAKSLSIPEHKVHNNIQRFGNCSAGSIPILLAEAIEQQKIKRGDKLCMAAFGSGFTWAGAVLTY